MSLPVTGWSNKGGTADRACKCGTWQQHWINFSENKWPAHCSVEGCSKAPTVGAHVINASADGERIAAMCDSCNKLSVTFALKGGVSVPSANKSLTCERKA